MAPLAEKDENGRYILHVGSRYSVVCAVRENGNSPAKDFIEQLEEQDRAKLVQFVILFRTIAQTGHIANKQHFRHERDNIWTFKRHQHRLPCFRDGNSFVITHGFVKKRDRRAPAEFEKAVNIRADDKARVLKKFRKAK